MQRRHMVGKNEILQVHQTGDRKPDLNARWPLQRGRRASGLKVTKTEVESGADPEVEQQKRGLEAAARELRAVAIGAADQFLFWFGGRFWPRRRRRRK